MSDERRISPTAADTAHFGHLEKIVTRYAYIAVLAGLMTTTAFADEQVPDGFTLREVIADGHAEGLAQPTTLAFAPDGRLFVAEREGAIRVIADGVLQTEPFAEIEVYTLGECGLLGLAIDPDFLRTRFIYVFATVSHQEQQIIRLRDENGVGVDPTIIRANLPTNGASHNGGCLRFGPDGRLYFAIGDTGQPELAQQMHTFAGKICRIEPSGEVPADNPFRTPTGAPRAVYALGFRNPFRFCFAPDGRLFAGDVGSSGDGRREELNLVAPGQNFGWPETEGFGPEEEDTGFTNPLLAYHEEGASIAGCAYYSAGAFPAAYHDGLFHLDFVSQRLYHVRLDGDEAAAHTFVAQLDGGPVDLIAGADGALYYAEIYSGRVMRLQFGADQAGDNPSAPSDDDAYGDRPSPCGAGVLSHLLVVTGVLLTMRCAYARHRPIQIAQRRRRITMRAPVAKSTAVAGSGNACIENVADIQLKLSGGVFVPLPPPDWNWNAANVWPCSITIFLTIVSHSSSSSASMGFESITTPRLLVMSSVGSPPRSPCVPVSIQSWSGRFVLSPPPTKKVTSNTRA